MNEYLRTCKHHWLAGDSLHWGRNLRRRPFAPPGLEPRFAPDRPFSTVHLRVELHLDFGLERAWGNTLHQCRVNTPVLRQASFDAVDLAVSRVTVNGKRAAFENTGQKVLVNLPRLRREDRFEICL